jgi:hypothetical protein
VDTRRSWALFGCPVTGSRQRRRTTDVSLIYVPFMAGDATHPVSQAPAHYARAGTEKLLADMGVLAGSHRIDIWTPQHAALDQAANTRPTILATLRPPIVA